MNESLGVRIVTSEQLKEGWLYHRPVKREYVVLRKLPSGHYEVLEPIQELMQEGCIYADLGAETDIEASPVTLKRDGSKT